LAVGLAEGVTLLTEEKPKYALSATLAVIQTEPSHVSVDFIGKKTSQTDLPGTVV